MQSDGSATTLEGFSTWQAFSVLVVDDEEGMRSFLERALKSRCGLVEAAGDVGEGVFLARERDLQDADEVVFFGVDLEAMVRRRYRQGWRRRRQGHDRLHRLRGLHQGARAQESGRQRQRCRLEDTMLHHGARLWHQTERNGAA